MLDGIKLLTQNKHVLVVLENWEEETLKLISQ